MLKQLEAALKIAFSCCLIDGHHHRNWRLRKHAIGEFLKIELYTASNENTLPADRVRFESKPSPEDAHTLSTTRLLIGVVPHVGPNDRRDVGVGEVHHLLLHVEYDGLRDVEERGTAFSTGGSRASR